MLRILFELSCLVLALTFLGLAWQDGLLFNNPESYRELLAALLSETAFFISRALKTSSTSAA